MAADRRCILLSHRIQLVVGEKLVLPAGAARNSSAESLADVGKACFFQLLGEIVVLTSAAEASSLGPAKLVGEGDEMNSHRLSQLTVL